MPTIVSDEKLEKYKRLVQLADAFYEDVLPQLGGLSIQDYAGMNEMGILLNQLKKKETE